MVNAQEWLDENYPKEGRKEIKRLGINNKDLEGNLDLNDFVNLEELRCYTNKLTQLELSNLSQLSMVYCDSNNLKNIKFSHYIEKLTWLSVTDNNFSKQDLPLFSYSVNLKTLYIDNNSFSGSLKPLRNMSSLNYLNIKNTDIDSGLEYLPENLTSLYCNDWCAEQLKNYDNYQAWRKDNLYWINKIYSLEEQLIGNQTIINNFQHELNNTQSQLSETNQQLNKTLYQLNDTNTQLNSWKIPYFWPQLSWNQPNSAVTFRTQLNSFDIGTIGGTVGLGIIARYLYREYKNRRQTFPQDEERQPLLQQEVERYSGSELNQIRNTLQEQNQIAEIAKIISLNEQPEFTTLKQEITRLKVQELSPQVGEEKAKLEQLITNAKNKAGNSEKIVDLLLETHRKLAQINETSQKDKLSGKIEAYQDILKVNLTQEEIRNLLTKQTELSQLEKHLESLQGNQVENFQAQIIQPTYGTPGSSKGGNN
ncbi:hypothetical protein [endosymbiont GvMRE of Glomus versiforme]|uniref:hypothetical protein n=1 Tax=endosymbiont GvMRE of Glomus versiforme TaxID=2039283 RepID=UPI000EE73124|nr:hypothetical protein [endosymbiont GvMRE of Glomus versiforme]RHZ36028.1 HET domain protein [endosymbiont GvMRE of Glomus versiforme]